MPKLSKELNSHKDTGCLYAPRCLECPFDLIDGKCLADKINKEKLFKDKNLRNEVIYKAWLVGRMESDLTELFKLSKQTIIKIIHKERRKKRKDESKQGDEPDYAQTTEELYSRPVDYYPKPLRYKNNSNYGGE